VAVRGPDRHHLGGRRGHHDPDHHLRPAVSAPDRLRSDGGQRQGVSVVAALLLDQVSKKFPDGTLAVADVNLEISDGEFVILVGPSGCGKSTTLNMIAGLEDVSSGDIFIDGERVNDRPPKDRDIAMVFQSYALYPNMTVRGNISFPLRLAKMDKREIERRVREVAHILELEPLLDRKPANLSAGQRQRVAMGRAIVRS